jgi:hypothetical protein
MLLLNLRYVPEDEADDVRRLLDANAIAYYETPPSLWGISAGGIWIRDDRDAAAARRLMAEYQRERAARARAEHRKALAHGTAPTFGGTLRTQPLKIALAVLAVALVLAATALPVYLLGLGR